MLWRQLVDDPAMNFPVIVKDGKTCKNQLH